MTKLDNHYNLFINGEWRQGSKGQVMLSDNPANNKPWASFDCASQEDIELAVQSARSVLNKGFWKTCTATERGKLLYKLADLIEENAETVSYTHLTLPTTPYV